MRTTRVTFGAALIAAALITPSLAVAQMDTSGSAARAFITEAAPKYRAHLLAGHLDSLTAMYAPDAVMMAPNMPEAHGSAAIKATLTALTAGGPPTAFQISDQTITVAGDIAVERGKYTITFNMNGRAVSDSGMYLAHWHKMGNTWMFIEHIWNSSNPPMPMAPPPPARRH